MQEVVMPRRADKNRLVPVNMSLPKSSRAKLEKAAKESGRSLTAEVSVRVESTFEQDVIFNDPERAAALRKYMGALLIANADSLPKLLEIAEASASVALGGRDFVVVKNSETPELK
jgi:TraY domain